MTVAVDENWPCVLKNDRRNTADECECRRPDFVRRANTNNPQRQMECRCATVDCNAVLNAHLAYQIALELIEHWTNRSDVIRVKRLRYEHRFAPRQVWRRQE